MNGRGIVLFLPGAAREPEWLGALRAGGYEVTAARSAYEALRVVQTARPRFAVTTFDAVGMRFLRSTSMSNPGLSGIAVAAGGAEGAPDRLQPGDWPRTLAALMVNVAPDDVLRGLRKLLREPFGHEHDLPRAGREAAVWRLDVRRSAERDTALEWIEGIGAGEAGLGRRTVRRLRQVCDELTTNGLYNAPVDDEGRPLYRTLPRPRRIDLAPSEAVRLTLAVTRDEVALAAADPFGSLPPEVALRHLLPALGPEKAAPRRTGGGGAGLGLFRTYRALSRMVINIESNMKTEVIGFLRRRRSPIRNNARERSLQLFVKEASTCRTD